MELKSAGESRTICEPSTCTATLKGLSFERKLLKKLLKAGESYYFTFNFKTLELKVIGGQTKAMLGCMPSEVNIPFLRERMHPEDHSMVINFESKVFDFFASLQPETMLKYKVRYDFRIRKKNGSFMRILHQMRISKQDEYGAASIGLGVHSDITYLKPEGKPMLSFIGLDGEASTENVDLKTVTVAGKDSFTRREKEVLTLLIDGKLSKEISNILHISKQTVDTHRKNMLHKKELNNTGELIGKAIRWGWI